MFTPSSFKYTIEVFEIFLLPATPLSFEIILTYQIRYPVLKVVYKWITEKSGPAKKTPFTTATPFLLEFYRIFPSLYFGESTKLITIITQNLKNVDNLPQLTDDNLSSQISRSCLSLPLFQTAFDKFLEHSHAGLHIAH